MQGDAVDAAVHVARRQQRPQRRGKAQAPRHFSVIKRLDPETVAHQRHGPAFPVMHGKGEHADQPIDRGRTPLRPGPQDDLGVRGGTEAVAQFLQFPPQLRIVVDAAVKHQRQPKLLDHEGLGPGLCRVDHHEAAVPEAHGAANEDPRPVRPPPGHRLGHGLQAALRRLVVGEEDLAANAAHERGFLSVLPIVGSPVSYLPGPLAGPTVTSGIGSALGLLEQSGPSPVPMGHRRTDAD